MPNLQIETAYLDGCVLFEEKLFETKEINLHIHTQNEKKYWTVEVNVICSIHNGCDKKWWNYAMLMMAL